MAKRRRTRKLRWDPDTRNPPSQTAAVCKDKPRGRESKGQGRPSKDSKLRPDHHKLRLNSDPGSLNKTTQGLHNLLTKSWKPVTSLPSPSLKNLSDHKYDRVIRDVVIHGTLLEQQLSTLIDTLTKIKSDPEEMEWEITNTTYLVPEQPPCLKDCSFAKLSSHAHTVSLGRDPERS